MARTRRSSPSCGTWSGRATIGGSPPSPSSAGSRRRSPRRRNPASPPTAGDEVEPRCLGPGPQGPAAPESNERKDQSRDQGDQPERKAEPIVIQDQDGHTKD